MRLLLAAALVCAASAGAAASEAFCAAAIDGDVEAMKKSLTNGVDVDYLCPTAAPPATALQFASYVGYTEVVRSLIEAGADVNNEHHQSGASPLFMATQQNHGDVVRLLLAELDPRDSIEKATGASPLHLAAFLGSIATLETLLDDGRLPVDGLTIEGNTPLHAAATAGQLKAIEALLRHGADASIASHGKTPADVASQNGHDEVHRSIRRLDGVDRVLLLRRHGAGERLGGRDAGRAGSDEQEYRAGEPHND